MKRPAVLGPRLVTSPTPGRRCGTRQCFGARVLSCRVAVDVERGDAGARSARCRRSGAAPRRSPQETGDAPPQALRRRRRGGRGPRRGRRKPGCRGDLAARARGSQVSNGMMIVPFGWSSCTNFWEPFLSAVTRREDNCECGEEGGSKSCGWLCDHTSPPQRRGQRRGGSDPARVWMLAPRGAARRKGTSARRASGVVALATWRHASVDVRMPTT